MARKRKGRAVSGWVVLDKPADMGSTPAVSKVRRIFDAQKAGHAGTLDPFATGLLPIALGEATKTINFVMDGSKTYEFTVQWGVETDTLDTEGDVTETCERRPTKDGIEAVLPRFLGRIEQVPPRFSAIKIDGQRAYDLARSGEEPDMPVREVEIEALELIDMPDADHARFRVDCGKGTYVRSLGRDIARALGTVGHLTALRRTKAGPFRENQAISLDQLPQSVDNPPDGRLLLPVEAALDGIPALALSDEEAIRLRNGQAVTFLKKMDLDRIARLTPGGTVVAVHEGRALAICRYEKAQIHPLRVLNQ